jgi:hypothetical protein
MIIAASPGGRGNLGKDLDGNNFGGPDRRLDRASRWSCADVPARIQQGVLTVEMFSSFR